MNKEKKIHLKAEADRDAMREDRYINARDERTDEKYEADVTRGVDKQTEVLDKIGYDYVLTNKEEKFMEFVPAYMPDAKVKVNGKWYDTEVKFAREITDEFDLKKNQVDKLAKLNGLILYCTGFRELDVPVIYKFIGATWVKRKGVVVSAQDSKVNHAAYRIKQSDIKWELC